MSTNISTYAGDKFDNSATMTINPPERIMAWPTFPEGISGTWSANAYYDEKAKPYIALAVSDARVEAAVRAGLIAGSRLAGKYDLSLMSRTEADMRASAISQALFDIAVDPAEVKSIAEDVF
jgi:hypothetical protein